MDVFSFLGQPRRVAITVQNPNEVPVIIHAITSKTMDFYFSFPEDKVCLHLYHQTAT